MGFRDTIIAECARRGVAPADSLDEPPFDPVEFYTDRLRQRISRLWDGGYVQATCDDPKVSRWAEKVIADDPDRRRGLLLLGETGRGKTWQAVGAIKAIVGAAAGQGRNVSWEAIKHRDLARRMRGDYPDDELDRYLDVEVLLLDDLGASMATDWVIDWTERLVDDRSTSRKTTIYTSNLAGEELPVKVGDRVYSRLGPCRRVIIEGPDRRWAR